MMRAVGRGEQPQQQPRIEPPHLAHLPPPVKQRHAVAVDRDIAQDFRRIAACHIHRHIPGLGKPRPARPIPQRLRRLPRQPDRARRQRRRRAPLQRRDKAALPLVRPTPRPPPQHWHGFERERLRHHWLDTRHLTHTRGGMGQAVTARFAMGLALGHSPACFTFVPTLVGAVRDGMAAAPKKALSSVVVQGTAVSSIAYCRRWPPDQHLLDDSFDPSGIAKCTIDGGWLW